jgi:8-oxo-dGTP pyrophosphatase MutT (NUDIX family)
MTSLRARLFWLISHVAHGLYSRFPIFGPIRGSVAILRRDGGFVVIDRNDGYGLGFPGGIARFGEPPENTVRREVMEETGLKISNPTYQFDYVVPVPFPNHTYVFEAGFDGELRNSWEGSARVATLTELQERIVPQQRRIVEHLIAQLDPKSSSR